MKWLKMIACAALSVSASPLVHAQGSAPEQEGSAARRTAARTLMREGNALYASGSVQGAYDRYTAAWQQAKGFDIACNLGRAALDLGRPREGAEYLDYCLRNYSLSSREDVVQAEQQIQDTFARAKSRVYAVTVNATPDGAELFVDGVSIGRSPHDGPVFVDPGPHRMGARLSGYQNAETPVAAVVGGEGVVQLDLVAVPAPAPVGVTSGQPERPKSNDGISPYVPAIITGAVAVAGLGVGIGLVVAAGSKDSDRQDKLASLKESNPCGSGTTHASECAQISKLSDDANTFRTVSYVSFGVALGGAVATYFLWPRDGTHAETATRVLPIAGPGVLGACAAGAF
jgi:hypothetical protein